MCVLPLPQASVVPTDTPTEVILGGCGKGRWGLHRMPKHMTLVWRKRRAGCGAIRVGGGSVTAKDAGQWFSRRAA